MAWWQAKAIYDLSINRWLCWDITTLLVRLQIWYLLSNINPHALIRRNTCTFTRNRDHISLSRGMSHALTFKDEEGLSCPLRERKRESVREKDRTEQHLVIFGTALSWWGCTAVKRKLRMCLIHEVHNSSHCFLLFSFPAKANSQTT